MSGSLEAQAQLMFRAALIIFLVTIVIGILNGLDLWDPPRSLLLTHVHAGTLGWITLAVIGAALRMFGDSAGDRATRSGSRLAIATIVATVLYVAAFAIGSGIYRPITGTLMLATVVWALGWVVGRRRHTPTTVPAVAMLLSLVSLVIGSVLGVLLGIFIANGSLPGLSAEAASNLAGAHPPAMLVGYLVLAGTAVAEWLLVGDPGPGRPSLTGVGVAFGLFLSGVLFNVAFIADAEQLIQIASMLEVVGIVVFIGRMWPALRPAAWRGAGSGAYARISVVFLAVGIGLLVYLVQLFVSGRIDPEAGEGTHLLIAFDHAMFIGVMTNALLGVIGAGIPFDTRRRLVLWGVNLGLAGFLVGLVAESSAVKRISTPIMGAALLLAVYEHLMRREVTASTP
jgi:hypothetical protein